MYTDLNIVVQDIVEKLLIGDAFVLKQAFTENSCKDIIDWCFNNISQTETSVHQIIDGVPNFHRIIDEEIKRLIDAAYAETERILDEHWVQVVAISEALLEYETLQADELEALMRGDSITRSSIGDLLDKEANTTTLPEPTTTEENDSDESTSGDAVPSPA